MYTHICTHTHTYRILFWEVFLPSVYTKFYFIFPETDDAIVLFISRGWWMQGFWTDWDIESLLPYMCQSSDDCGRRGTWNGVTEVHICLYKTSGRGQQWGLTSIWGLSMIKVMPIILLGKIFLFSFILLWVSKETLLWIKFYIFTFFVLWFLLIGMSLWFCCSFTLSWIRKMSKSAWYWLINGMRGFSFILIFYFGYSRSFSLISSKMCNAQPKAINSHWYTHRHTWGGG